MSAQIVDLFADVPAARASDPVTSHLAAESAKELRARHHRLILSTLLRGSAGKDRIAALTGLTGVQVCRRLTELARAGRIEQTGRLVASDAGRVEREWQLVIGPLKCRESRNMRKGRTTNA